MPTEADKAKGAEIAYWADNERHCGDCPCPKEFGGPGHCTDLALVIAMAIHEGRIGAKSVPQPEKDV